MQKIAILYDASQVVLSTFDLDEVLVQILNIVRDYFNVANAGIFLLEKNSSELYIRQYIGELRDASVPKVEVGTGIIGNAAKMKRPLYVPDVAKDSRYIRAVPGTRSELSIPLMVRDEVVGVLDIQSDKPSAFDSETVDLLTMFSTQASIAIENARLYSLEQRRAAQLEAINAIARQTTAVLDPEELLPKVCRLVLEHFDVVHVAIFIKQGVSLQMAAHLGRLTPVAENTVLGGGTGLAAQALDSGETIIENTVNAVEGYAPAFIESASEMCIPLIFFGEKLGVLSLISNKARAFADLDVNPLQAVADICAAAIKNCQHFEAAKELANHDGLTGIFNRRYFEERINEEIERAVRYGSNLSVLMVDIDHFKRLNDEFGHMLGDEVLRVVSRVFIQQLRKTDIVCRYGGEEFAIILPQISRERGLDVAEKLRRNIESWHFPGIARPVTISVGLASAPQNGILRDEVVAAADAALYEAKQSGRNSVVLAPQASSATR